MKKLLLFCSLLLSLLPLPAAAETQTITFADQNWTDQYDLTSQTPILTTEISTLSFAKNDGSNPPKYFTNNKDVRLYANKSGGNGCSVTVRNTDATKAKITGVSFYDTIGKSDKSFTKQSDGSFIFQNTNTSSDQVRFTALTITYEKVATGPVDYTLNITKELTLTEDDEYPISNFNIPADAPTLTWSSSNEDVVAEIEGTIMAGVEGTATLTASWDAFDNYNAGSHEIAVTVTKPLAAETPVIKYNGEVVAGDEIEVLYKSVLEVESTNATSITIKKTGSAPVVIDGNKGTFVADVEEVYTITAIGKGGNAERDILISFLKAGMPVITINGKQIENNCFYNVTENAPALISAENAVSFTIYDPNAEEVNIAEDGSFTISLTGEYIATASNGVDDSDTFSFTIGKLLEAQPGEPVEPVYEWRKITNVEDLTEEGEYVIAATTQGKAISTATDGDNDYYRPNIGVTIDGDVIKNLPTSGNSTAMIFNIEKTTAGTIYWKATNFEGSIDKGSYLYSMNTSKNYLQIGAKNNNKNDDVAATSVSISDGVTTITFSNCKNNGTARRLQFNKNGSFNKFGGYAADQEAIDVYKKFDITPEPENKVEVVEYLPEITAEGHLTFTNDEVAKVLKFESKIEGVRFHHCIEKNAPAQKSMHKAPQAATWTELANGEYDHSDNENGTHIWVKALKDSSVNEATIESPEFWQFITPEGTTTGIESVAAEAEGEGELFNLQGVRVDRATAAPGLYIERRGGKAVKVIL